jgi:hypothetical protein
MPAVTMPVPAIAVDPGYLFIAPLGTAEPTHTVVGSVFTDTWPAPWKLIGATEEGHNFTFSTSTETIEVAEFLDPIKYVETGRSGSIATTMASYTPPALGASVRQMIGWESQDSTERLVAYQCFNTAGVSIARRKGAAKATIPVEFALEVPTSGAPFRYLTAGATRGA